MRRVLKNNEENKKYLDTLPKIYMVGFWANYGIREYIFTNKYTLDKDVSVPLVYDYDDGNGTRNVYILRKLTATTTGSILLWTQNKQVAERFLQALSTQKFAKWNITEKGCVIRCSNCGERLEMCYPDGTEISFLPYCPYCGCNMREDYYEKPRKN